MICAIEHQAVGAVRFSRVSVDGNRYARHVPQCFLHTGIMPLFNHISCDNIDIGVCLKGLHRSTRCRDYGIPHDMFFYRLGLSIRRGILRRCFHGQGTESKQRQRYRHTELLLPIHVRLLP